MKKLAGNVSNSTSSIIDEIGAMQGLSARISENVRRMSDMIGQVKEGSSTVAAATEEKSTVMSDIATQMGKLSSLISEI